jgi:PKD repeat protein
MARVLIALAVILPAAASAIETVGMVGDGRFLCATDNQAPLAADAPSGVSFVDLSVAGMADFTWTTSSVPALADDAILNYDQTKYPVSWLGTPATLGAGKAFQIDSNGLVTLEDESLLGINSYNLQYSMPNPSGQPKGVIAPLWMDLTVCGPGSKIYIRQEGTAANPIRTLIEWAGFGHWTPAGYGIPGQDSCASGQVTFELIWDHTQPRADIVFPNGFSLPAGINYQPGPPPISGQGVDSGVQIGGSDVGEIFGIDYRYVSQGGAGNSAGLTLPAGLVVRLVECDGPAISVLPASPRVDEGSTLALTGSATAYSNFGVGGNWRWTASVGSLSAATTATPTLSAVGLTGATTNINVTATVNDGKGRDGTKTFPVQVRNIAPQISAVNAAAGGGGPPVEASPVTFTASFTDPGGLSTHPGGDGPFIYLWAFDDGTSSAFATPTKGFADSGSHPVNLTITDFYGAASTVFTLNLTVQNVPPTVTSFTAAPTTANEGQSITFTAAANDPSPVDQAAGFSWTFDFGDPADPGNVVTGTASQVSHTYRHPGSFTPSVVATDKDGGASSPYFLPLPVTVNNVPPAVTVDCPAAVDVNVVATCTCQIVDPGSALETYSVSWDFGDGTQGAGNPVQHAWSSGGTKTVSCTADDGGLNGKGTSPPPRERWSRSSPRRSSPRTPTRPSRPATGSRSIPTPPSPSGWPPPPGSSRASPPPPGP